MHSLREEHEEFNKLMYSPIKGVTTRAIVVSNTDPLCAGRVKVWIPVLHGGFNMNTEVDIETPSVQPSLPKGCLYPGDWRSEQVQALLPWAKCLGSNWGPHQNSAGTAILISGVFSTPKVGTEVYVIFENNDPNLPVIIGAYFHSNEFTYAKYRPLELYPGQQVSTSLNVSVNRFNADGSLAPIDQSDYAQKSSGAYSIRAENDSMLYISDTPGESAIMLSGLIHLSDLPTITAAKNSAIAAAYPGFPTTSSAAFATRILLSTAAATTTLQPPLANNTSGPFNSEGVNNFTTVVTPPPPPPEAPPAQPTSSVKMWPVKPPAGKSLPPFPSGYPQGNFGAPRPSYRNAEKKHVGIDIVAANDNSTICVAPMDMYPLFYNPSVSAGNYILCLAVDGTGHSFLHLYDIFPNILQIIKSTPGILIKAGTPIGHCGNTGTSSRGHHLHWEVFKNAANAKSGPQLSGYRQNDINQGTSQFYNPIDWMGMAATIESTIQGSPDQHRSYIDHATMYSNTNDVNFAKPIGLEMSTVPGQETLFLRHPSGSYFGFDCDGNIVGFSVGDFNWRGNRSWNLDILGGILETCYAKFTRVRTVIRNWAKIFSNMKDKPDSDSTYPQFFQRAEKFRRIDMVNAIHSTLGNAFYVSPDGAAIPYKDAYSSATPGIVTPPNTSPRNTKLTTYDAMIQASYAKWITGTMSQYFSDWKWFKAQMLIESNGDPTAEGTTGRIGLFQLLQSDVEAVLSSGSLTQAEFNAYSDPAKNIDMALQIMAKRFFQGLQANVNSYVTITPAATTFNSLAATDITYLTFFSYKVTNGVVSTLFSQLAPEVTLTYSKVESLYSNQNQNDPNGSINLQYVPTLLWLHGQL